MAAFANNKGGYIVFGIKDDPREIIGIDRSNFDTFSQERFTAELNDIFQPAIEWEVDVYDLDGKTFGLIYTSESETKPIIATKNDGDIKEGEIYFRYRARSEKIHFPELRKLLDKQIEKQNDAWRRVITKSAQINPINVAVMNTLNGEISGNGGTVVIGEELIPKLKFIREGDFTEKNGSPTLKLVGELQAVPVSAVKRQKILVGEDIYIYRPSHVASEVARIAKIDFGTGMHTKAWKFYKVRPQEKRLNYKSEIVEYKSAENDYRYSQAWINFLASKMRDKEEYGKVANFKH